MESTILFVLSSFLSLGLGFSEEGQIEIVCDKIDACKCNSSKGIIDLSPLDSKDPRKPTFEYLRLKNGNKTTDTFSWNPCTPFTDRDCKNVSTCQIEVYYRPNQVFNIGEHFTAKFLPNHSMPGMVNMTSLTIMYQHSQQGNTRVSYVMLLCDRGVHGSLIPYGETGYHSMKYFFILSSRYGCPGYKDGFPLYLIAISMVAGLFGLFFLCFFVGIFINIGRKRRGCDILPLPNFCRKEWRRVPPGAVRL